MRRAKATQRAARLRRVALEELTAAGLNVTVEADRKASKYGRPATEGATFTSGEVAPCGKIGFTSRREANKKLTEMLRIRAVRGQTESFEIRSYRCDRGVCRAVPGVDMWHTTSRNR